MHLLTEEEIFAAAIQKPLAERAEFLERACLGDANLRAQVEALLAAHDKPDSFLEVPAEAVATIEQPVSERLGMQIGPYKLLQKLGEGGMGSVYLAEQQQPVKRHVALKIIKAGMDSAQVIARFEQERQALAIMDHPHIAKVLDAGTTDGGRPYFVMELVKGIPITRYCDQEHLSPRERLELFIPVCQAVQHAHQKGIIHRDLKPSNVLIALYDGKPVPKVIDFGVAKATSQKLTERTLFTEVGSIVGTLEYMAPEQAELNNLDIDTRADIYSLGVLLYELLTGATPFSGHQLRSAGFNEMLRIIKEVEPQKPSTKLSASAELPSIAANRRLEPNRLTRLIRGDLDWIVMKCLEKERGRRYETANAFAMDIQRYLADEPVLAGPPSTAYRLKKFLRRNKGPVLAAALVVLMLVGGIVGTTWGLIQAEKSRQRQTARAEAEAQQRRRAESAELTARSNEQHAAAERNRAVKAEADANDERSKAVAEKQRADEEAAIAKAVKDFLQNRLLNQADAENQADAVLQAGGTSAEIRDNPTIRELLDRAADELTPEKIETQFPGLPLVQAEILRTIGAAYRGIGEYKPAITHLERSRDLHVAHRGPTHLDTMTTLYHLACVYSDIWNMPEAIQLFEQVRDQRIAQLGADHQDTLATLFGLAWAYQAAGRLPEAIQLNEQVRDKQIAKLGPDHSETLSTLANVAGTYRAVGRVPEAIQLYEQVRDKQIAQLGLDHPLTLSTLQNLALTYQAAERFKEAIQLNEQVRDMQIAKLGPDHPLTLATMNNLAMAYRTAGKLPEAIRLNQEVRDRMIAKLGPDHRWTLNALTNLALAYQDAGRFTESIRLFEQVRDQHIAKLGLDHPRTQNTLANLAKTYTGARKFPEAIQLFEQLRDQQTAKLGPDHPNTLNALNNLALAYRASGKLTEAIQLFEQLRDKQVEKLGPDNKSTLGTLSNLALAYRTAGRLKDAIQLNEQVRDKMIAKLAPDDPWTLNALYNLALAYRDARRFPEAIQIFEQVREQQIPKLGPDHPDILSRLHTLALAYRAAGSLPEALGLWEELVSRARRVLGPAHPSTMVYTTNWVLALEADRQFGKAVEIRRDAAAFERQRKPPDLPRLSSALDLLGQSLLKAEQFADAEPVLTECLALREKAIPNSYLTFSAKSLLGGSLLGQKKYDAAEPLLLAGYEGTKQREDQIPTFARVLRPTQALQRLIDLYTAWDKPHEAAKWRKILDESNAAEKPAADPTEKP